MAKRATNKRKNLNANKNVIQRKNKYLKWIDSHFSIIFICIMILFIILTSINNINLKKLINKMNKQQQIKYVIKRDKIIFLGDSITYGYDLQKYYNDQNVLNKGNNGDTTLDILDRLQESVFDYNAKTVILLIGTNDINRGIDPIDNIELIIKRIKNHDPKINIIVQSIYPISLKNNSKIDIAKVGNRSNKKIEEVNQKIEAICKNYQATYVDIYHKLIDQEGNLKLQYTKEGLHISEKGYIKITNILNKYVK